VTILWNQQVQTDRTIPIKKPDIIIQDTEKRTRMLIDVAISGDRNVIKKEAKKIFKYKDLTIDELQTMAHQLNLIARKYKMAISSTKTKSMAMCGNYIQRVKIVINDNIIEQILNTWGTMYQNTKVI